RFIATATTEISPLSLHDALPISTTVLKVPSKYGLSQTVWTEVPVGHKITFPQVELLNDSDIRTIKEVLLISENNKKQHSNGALLDRKSTRLNSSHVKISYAVFCL